MTPDPNEMLRIFNEILVNEVLDDHSDLHFMYGGRGQPSAVWINGEPYADRCLDLRKESEILAALKAIPGVVHVRISD